MTHLVFAYGSLLSPTTLLSTLPGIRLDDVAPAKVRGYQRVFDVAFPNDGSQADKAYYSGEVRPPFVLFVNLSVRPSAVVNGILIPVSDSQLDRLRERERRYELTDCSGAIESTTPAEAARVVTFTGMPAFTTAEDVGAGVVAQNYVDLIQAGARHWDERHPGFLNDFHESTQMPSADAIVPLRRVDLI